MKHILSIDGGGTKTLGVLYNESGHEVERWIAGPAALHVDFEAAWGAIEQIIEKAAAYQPQVVLGISGAETSAMASEIPRRILSQFSLDAEIMSDIKLSYFAHHGRQCGMDIIAGTGSVVMAYDNEQFLIRGGWGARLGDEGSAFGLVRTIVRLLLTHLEDGTRVSATAEVLEAIGVANKAELIQWTYGKDRMAFAGAARNLAPLNNRIVQEAIAVEAEALAKTAGRLLGKLQEPFEVGLTGSVFDKNEVFQRHFRHVLNRIAGRMLSYHPMNEENVFGGYRYIMGK